MATNVSLTAELETFARSCVESGRYNNVSEVVRAGLRLLQENEERRARFGAMLDEALPRLTGREPMISRPSPRKWTIS